jgi:hypothetical protein
MFGGQLKVILLEDLQILLNKIEAAHHLASIKAYWKSDLYKPKYTAATRPNISEADVDIWTALCPNLKEDLLTILNFENEES